MQNPITLAVDTLRVYLTPMTPIFDMDDRARLPWRFYGANCTILAHL